MKLLAMVLIVFVSGCVSYNQGGSNQTQTECTIDSDCFVAGCSKQLCVPPSESDAITTCEYKAEYQCLEQTSCSCVQNKCAWKDTPDYQNCLEQVEDIGQVV